MCASLDYRAFAHPVLSIFVLASYLAAALWLVASAYRASDTVARGRRLAGLAFGCVAVAFHAVDLWQAVAARPNFALTIAETASFIGLGIAVIALLAAWRAPRFAAASAALLALAGVFGSATNEGAPVFAATQHGWELKVHIALSVLAYALITVGFALAIASALLDRRLRNRQPLGWLSMLPSLEAMEGAMFAALGAGFAILSLALFSGFVFVEDLRAQHLSRKAVLSSLAWIMLGILLFGRWRFGWRGRTALYWTLGGFLTLGLGYFGSRLVLEQIFGRHWG